ncbi:MAG: NAD(P)-dependent oxidoreductase [Pseudomonadota bacterium]|nr:NAD(P)-dependent oxidoreductase [Pseudomonadota bacterium]
MTVLVTGAGGLIASRIVHKLVEQGEKVLALDRVSPLSGLEELQQRGKVRVAEADVTDLSAIETAISDNQVSRIIHTAAILPPTSEEDPSRGCDVNIGGTNNIFDAASRLGVKRVVYPSSIAVYGDQSDHGETVLNEESPRFPFSLYGVAKQANELAARAYLANTGLDSRGLRICTVFGHGRVTDRSAAASAMISAVAIGEPYVSPVIASQTSAYIYVEDVAECLIRLAFATRLERDVYCVPTHSVSLGKIAEKLRAILPDAEIAFALDAAGFEQINRMDGTRLKRDLGYTPPSLDDRIRHQIDVARRKRQQPPLR